MRIEKVTLDEISRKTLDIGFMGEKNHTQVQIVCAVMFDNYPNAVATMVAKPPQGDLYPVILTRDGNKILWDVSESDIATAGSGSFQLTFTDGSGDSAEIIKTVYGSYVVKPSMQATGDPPEPLEDWLEEAQEVLSDLQSFDNISASATTLAAGSSATAEITTVGGHKNIAIGVPKGEPGDPAELIDDTETASDKAWSSSKTDEELSDVKSALSVLENVVKASDVLWERGGYNYSPETGVSASSYHSDYRARMPVNSPSVFGKGSIFSPNSGYYCLVITYDSVNGYHYSDWILEGSYTIQNDSKVWVIVRAATESGDQIPLDTLISGVTIISKDAIDQLNDRIDKVESDIDSAEGDIESLQDAVFATTNVSLVNNSDDVGSGAMANTRRWILPSVIPAGSTISNIKYHTASSISGTITFEIWKKNGDTLTLDKTVTDTPVASSEITVAINYTSATDVMLGWIISNGTNIRHRAYTTFNMWATTDMSSSTLDIDDLDKTAFTTYTPCITVPYTNVSAKKYAQFTQNVVTVGEGMDFEQIQDAIDGIVDDSASKPYTILVMPKGTPYERFSTLRSFDQTYPWNSINPRYISIIGMDRKNCIVRSDSGNYKLPCGEPMLNGMIKNLTFIMTNDDQDENATQGGYCLHIDCRTNNDVGYNMVIEDCDFEDASGPCLGIGMHENCTLTIRRCNFKTTLSANYSPHEGYTNLYNYGVIFCHSSTRADATNQRINIEDCFGVCAEGDKSLWLSIAGDYSPETASFYYRLLRNVFWNETQNAPAYSISGTLTAEPMNFGNNIPT